MRVLLAIDGSPSAEAARSVVDTLAWPAGTSILVLGVTSPTVPLSGALGGLPLGEPDNAAIEEALGAALVDAASSLMRPGRRVERRLVTGRPATCIVDEAAGWGAELLVVGSRGLGRLSRMVLGSVSAEVVDHAPCPVLVTRASSISTVLVAVDGSVSSRLALEHLDLGYLGARPMEVLCVGPAGPSPVQVDAIAAQGADELARSGHRVRWSIGTGDPAHEIIEAASALDCDLIAMGSRGHTGLARLRLGSVARNVLLHTHASVLVVRGPVRVREGGLVEEQASRSPVAAGT